MCVLDHLAAAGALVWQVLGLGPGSRRCLLRRPKPWWEAAVEERAAFAEPGPVAIQIAAHRRRVRAVFCRLVSPAGEGPRARRGSRRPVGRGRVWRLPRSRPARCTPCPPRRRRAPSLPFRHMMHLDAAASRSTAQHRTRGAAASGHGPVGWSRISASWPPRLAAVTGPKSVCKIVPVAETTKVVGRSFTP